VAGPEKKEKDKYIRGTKADNPGRCQKKDCKQEKEGKSNNENKMKYEL
jgi:hypothetical protein